MTKDSRLLVPVNPKGLDDIARALLEGSSSPPITGSGSTTPATDIASPENYIILPGKTHNSYSYPELFVSMDRRYLGSNWVDSHTSLQRDGFSMLTPRQFVDFLELLKSGRTVYNGRGIRIDSAKINDLVDDITTKRDPYRAEWLDADFKVVGSALKIHYNHKIVSGQLKPQNSEALDSCLMEDSYADLIGSANKQGFPTRKSRKQDFYFYYPRSDNMSVARFGADSGRVGLDCGRDPQDADAGLGVRAAKIKR